MDMFVAIKRDLMLRYTLLAASAVLFFQGCYPAPETGQKQHPESLPLAAEGKSWDYLWGTWELKPDPSKLSFTFEKTKMMIKTDKGEEVWDVIKGKGLLSGLKVKRGEQVLEATATVKFNEMILTLGERRWLLRKKGSKDVVFPRGMVPNSPPKIIREPASEIVSRPQPSNPEQVAEQIASLRKFIIPPKGTSKTDVDAVFGTPERIEKLTGKGSPASFPQHRYHLLPPKSGQGFRARLRVTYRNDKAHFIGINHLCIIHGRYKAPLPAELARENRLVLADLLEIKTKYEYKLRAASWNK